MALRNRAKNRRAISLDYHRRDKYHGITTPSYLRYRLECYLAWYNRYLMPKDAVARAQFCPVPLR